ALVLSAPGMDGVSGVLVCCKQHRDVHFYSLGPPPPRSTLFPYTTLFRSLRAASTAVLRKHSRHRQSSPLTGIGRRAGKGEDCLRSEEHTSELQSRGQLVCRLLLEKKKIGSCSAVWFDVGSTLTTGSCSFA